LRNTDGFTPIHAQEKKSLGHWTLYRVNNVSWIQQGNDGTLRAAGDKALVGLDHKTGEIRWTNAALKPLTKRLFFFNVEGLPSPTSSTAA
jgi:hypothetical protein